MTPRAADVAPSWGEAVRQMIEGMASLSVLSHPLKLAAMATHCLPRHGMTPAAAIVATALAWGDAVALTDQWGNCSYRELAAITGRLAAMLSDRGWVTPGTDVGVMVRDDRWIIAAYGAIGLCGGTVWPLNPKLGADDLADRLRGGGVELVIHSPGCEAALAGFPGRTISTAALPEMLADARGLTVPRLARRSGFVMLTGGTTSTPSAVPIKRRWSAPLTGLALAGATGVRHGRPTLLCAPLFHGYGLEVAMLCLISGSPLILNTALPGVGAAQLDKGGRVPRIDWGTAILHAIEQHRVHSVFAVPAQLRSLAGRLDAGPTPSTTTVRSIVSGADRIDEATIRSLIRHWGPVVTNYYGTTESGTLTVIAGAALAAQPDALGRPVAGVRLRIVDTSGRVLRRGQVGLVQAVSPLASFGTGWRGTFTTSDLGFIDDAGQLHLQGRAGAVQRLGGEFVDLTQVESVLADFPGVITAKAWLTPDDAMGQRVAAAVTTNGPVSVESLRAHVRARLGPAAVPVSIEVSADT